MDFNKTSKLLKKFKGLHHTLRDSGQEPSSIEKDLLLSYLKEMYEQVMTIGAESAIEPVSQPKVAETITASSNGNGQTYTAAKAPVVSSTVVTPPVVSPPVVQKVEAPAPVQVSPAVPAEPIPDIVPPSPPVAASGSGPLQELFADKSVSELSDKLNKLPITDINRAMGINEKVLTINELFNGNQELFSKTMLKLNSLVSFEEAKNYLIAGVASDLKWAGDGKLKKADKFIQLLRRRYS